MLKAIRFCKWKLLVEPCYVNFRSCSFPVNVNCVTPLNVKCLIVKLGVCFLSHLDNLG